MKIRPLAANPIKIDFKVNSWCNFGMEKFSNLFEQILLQAKSVGLNQKELADRAGVRQETLSRAKKRGTVDATTLEKLANVLHADFSLNQRGLRDPKWMLAWSNPSINDDVLIRKALLTARFSTILQACLEFGISRVTTQWQMVSGEVAHSTGLVNDILSNIRRGFEHAQA